MRLLIVSTPRSGNTWFRHLLCGALDVPELAVHRPGDVNWAALPHSCVIQMHWRARPDVLKICREFGIRPIVIVRHPLDVLISVLHFCTFEPETRSWLDGEGGGEGAIQGKDPADPAFAAYALSPRAAALLAASMEWMERGVPFVRFENLVARTQPELERFLHRLRAAPVRPLAKVIEEHTLEKSRRAFNNQHSWQGRPGIWRHLVGRDLAWRIQQAHAPVFESQGYHVDDACDRTPEEIRAYWRAVRVAPPRWSRTAEPLLSAGR